MNPRTDLDDHQTEVARAYLTLLRKCGEQFQFAVDSDVKGDEEVRGNMIKNADKSAISVTAINRKSEFDEIVSTAQDMGLCTEIDSEVDNHELFGSYEVYTMEATVDSVGNRDWNTPHLVIYGSLTPQTREICRGLFNHRQGVDFCEIRNHYIVYGESISEEDRNRISDAVQRSDHFFEDDKRHIVSNIRTASMV